MGPSRTALKKATVLPVWEEMPADLLTPVSAYLRLNRGGGKAFLLESVEGGERLARYSYLGVDPVASLRIAGDRLEIQRGARRSEALAGPPLERLGTFLAEYRAPHVAELPPFTGGAVGTLHYECAGMLEDVGAPAVRTTPLDAHLMLFRDVVAFDHVKRRVVIVANVFLKDESAAAGRKRARARIAAIRRKLTAASDPLGREKPLALGSGSSTEPRIPGIKGVSGRARFCAGVRALKRHIRAGDIFQAVLSEQFRFPLQGDPFAVYRALRSVSPAPFLFHLDFGDQTFLGASPELLVKVEARRVETCPIAGTRPRGRNERQDAAFEKSLLASVKERAEHLMLVDLGRNDLGRVSAAGSVTVRDFMHVERFSHVMHLVSNVEGKLARGRSAWDALLACFPAGTLSGAPKIRAMQLLAELEPVQRGPYGGAVVCQDFHGGLSAAIAIRSLLVRDGQAWLQAGAGIVADSQPAREYEEVLNKTRAMRRAVELSGALQRRPR